MLDKYKESEQWVDKVLKYDSNYVNALRCKGEYVYIIFKENAQITQSDFIYSLDIWYEQIITILVQSLSIISILDLYSSLVFLKRQLFLLIRYQKSSLIIQIYCFVKVSKFKIIQAHSQRLLGKFNEASLSQKGFSFNYAKVCVYKSYNDIKRLLFVTRRLQRSSQIMDGLFVEKNNVKRH
ncbi:unnamed protein product (macronuclear) [Paramecium tetraurelia]|uniref:Uncharacterized protein n=1 Tax=Paramecium tetraurelia TaxID=5888 RepID=A0CL32_PARTE|nr:uncharacterized protein GSPATT00008046001 [Paramecium tetraurelia]CAK71499.1 unnamed protein product [Paramecium tetraurelia]|eukprot:XP_001438896.1 hypothetical protein (macronuclear) [Paramecium tetraurelia strain d4-2]